MPDLQYIQFSDALNLTGASEVPDMEPRTLELIGEDFRTAIEVLINEMQSPSFVVASNRVILAQVPEGQEKERIRNVTVLSSEFTATFRSKIRFRIGDDPKTATGLRSMMQTFLKVLFTTVGTDAFSPTLGGSGLKNIGQNFSLDQTSNLVSEFAIAVSRTAQQIRTAEARQTRIPDDERLLSATVLSLRYDANISTLLARVELIAQSGTRAIANLEL